EWVAAVAPQYVIFSRGCQNRYGHPAEEVVNRLIKYKIPTLDTCEDGSITFRSDGTTLRPPSSR
ncbi:MAG: MBL fold metallo-hydrolase, partial [Patescibacteria group bacterium]